MEETKESKAKCPKCGSVDLTLIEVWKGHEITWEQREGKFNMKEGNLEPGNPYKVECKCSDCSHHWTVRKAIQIGDILKDN